MSYLRAGLALAAALVGGVFLVPFLILAAPFAAVSAATRLLARLFEPGFSTWPTLIEFDPEFGWRPKSNLRTSHCVDDIYRLSTDGDGWRGPGSIEDADVVAIGDSFAWGFGIDDEDFFASLEGGPRIKAVGTVGYSMVHGLLLMRSLGSRLSGKLVVWLVYYGNDLYDNLTPHMLGYRAPFVARRPDGQWEVVTEHISRARWFYQAARPQGGQVYLDKVAESCAPTYFAERAFAACRYLAREGRDACQAAGARLVIMSIPEKIQYDVEALKQRAPAAVAAEVDPDYPDRRLGAICEELGIGFVPLKQQLGPADYKQEDCHWNRQGHRRVAAIIAGCREQSRTGRPFGGEADAGYREVLGATGS